MTESSLAVALVGCGSIAEHGILPHLKLQGLSLTALCDVSESRLLAMSERFSVPMCYTSLEQLLANPAIDAVLIASPMRLHYEQAKAALTAGKHVYVQKPLAESGSQCRELIGLAERKNLILAASPGQMLLPVYERAAQLIQEQKLGVVYSALAVNCAPGHEHEARRGDFNNPALNPAWYYQPGGGPLRDMGIYSIHTLMGLLGDVDEVFTFASTPVSHKPWGETSIPVDVEDNFSINLRFKNGPLAQILTAFCVDSPLMAWGHISIVGSAGAMDIRRIPGFGSRYELVLRLLGDNDIQRETFGSGLGGESDNVDEAHVALDIIDFLAALRDGRPPKADAVLALKAIEVVEAAEHSIANRRPNTPGKL